MRLSLHTVGMVLGSALLVGASQASAAANLLTVNPSFEAGTFGVNDFAVYSTGVDGWRVTSNGNYVGVTNQGASGKDGNNFVYNVNGIFETLDSARPEVNAGTTYEFSFIAEADYANADTSAAISIDWYTTNSGYTPASSTTEILTIAETGAFQPYSITGIAPVGALFAGVRYDTSVIPGGANAWFDKASLSVVPEPTALSIAGIVGAGLLARRRRAAKA